MKINTDQMNINTEQTEQTEQLSPVNTALDNVIVLKQLPIIIERLEELTGEIESRTQHALSLAVTEETVKTVKEVRAALRKEHDALEEKRKAVKNAVLAPYESFEAAYKAVTGKYTDADKIIKERIDTVERTIKDGKRADVRKFFTELAADKGIDFINFDVYMPDVRMTDTPTALKKSVKTYLDKISEELALITEQEYADEILVEYKRLPDFASAMRTVQTRHRELDEIEKRKAEQREREAAEREARAKVAQAVAQNTPTAPAEPAAPLAPPVAAKPDVQADPLMKVAFTVTARRSQLRALKQYILSQEGLKLD